MVVWDSRRLQDKSSAFKLILISHIEGKPLWANEAVRSSQKHKNDLIPYLPFIYDTLLYLWVWLSVLWAAMQDEGELAADSTPGVGGSLHGEATANVMEMEGPCWNH
jgi:hypothetical protein